MQCQTLTNEGIQCTRESKTDYCWQHQSQDSKLQNKSILPKLDQDTEILTYSF